MSIEDRIRELGLVLPDAPATYGNYLPTARTGNLVFTSGQIPKRAGELLVGTVGDDVALEAAQEAARLCCLAALAAVKAEVGDLGRIERVVKVSGYVRSAPGFTDQPGVINGCSDLLVEILGDRGRHARAAIGVSELPLGVPVEIDFVFEVSPD